MPDIVIAEMERKMKAALEDLTKDLGTLRTGRATPALLDKVSVEYYGAMTPLSQIGNISVPDPRQLLITPWEKNLAGQIVNAILKSGIGLQATTDGGNVRVSVPALNEERRKEMVKSAHKKAEEHKVAVRNVRREAIEKIKKMEKENDLTKDDVTRYESDAQKATDVIIAEIDRIRAAKEADILEV